MKSFFFLLKDKMKIQGTLFKKNVNKFKNVLYELSYVLTEKNGNKLWSVVAN